MHLQLPIFERIVAELDAGRRVALCAVVKTRGSVPQAPGAMMIVDEAMQTAGTLGGGCVEAEVRKQAFELLKAGAPKLLDFQLDHDFGWDDGLICGGGMDVAVVPLQRRESAGPIRRALEDLRGGRDAILDLQVERHGQRLAYQVRVEREPTLLIAGAGHVGTELARLCVGLEFRAVVVDERADFADAQRLPPPIEPVVADIERYLREYPVDPATYVVIVTRGHKHDESALAAVVNSNAKYIGLIGSRRKIKLIRDDLLAAGVAPERLDRVHAPIGVAIDAVTVPEIAVSIAAQLIQVRRADKYKMVAGPFPLPAEVST